MSAAPSPPAVHPPDSDSGSGSGSGSDSFLDQRPLGPASSALRPPRGLAQDSSPLASPSKEPDAYSYGEQDEKRLHEADAHFWAQRAKPQAGNAFGASELQKVDLTTNSLGGHVPTPYMPHVTATEDPLGHHNPGRGGEPGDALRRGNADVHEPEHAVGRFAASPAEAAVAMAGMGALHDTLASSQGAAARADAAGASAKAASASSAQAQPQDEISAELKELYVSLQRCLDLRDKYMSISLQGDWEDNPKNWDAEYVERWRRAQNRGKADASSAASRATATPPRPLRVDGCALAEPPEGSRSNPTEPKPWRIYPAPPRPHWELFNPAPSSSFVVRPDQSSTSLTSSTNTASILVDSAADDVAAGPSGPQRAPSSSSSVQRTSSANPLPPAIPPASPSNAAAAQELLESTGGRPGTFDVRHIEIPGAHRVWTTEAEAGAGGGKGVGKRCRRKVVFKLDEQGVHQVFQVDDDDDDDVGDGAPRHRAAPASEVLEPRPLAESEVPADARPLSRVPTLGQYFADLDYLLGVASDGPCKSFAWRRLKILESKWDMYFLNNEYRELADMKRVPHRDFYNVRKVDTHVHHSASMNQKHLLRFIKAKIKRHPDDVVTFRDGRHLTLAEVFESLKLTAYDLSIDTLDMHAHQDAFHRFDKFNLKYNPIGESRLREIFLKTDNLIRGRYLAEMTRELMADLEQSKYQMAEYRVSVYGRRADEWDRLAAWVVDNRLFSPNVRWLVQVPRLYEVYKANGTVDNFQQIIANVFGPVFEVTQDPRSHPKLHIFLQRVIGFDVVDDESRPERRIHRKFPVPRLWDYKQSPPYNYWMYYMFANVTSLNQWRRMRGFNTFVLRPHAGEAGDTDHLAATFLTSQSISHGILLRKVPALQYLYYLKQVGLAMSPLSNNALFLSYERNPFPSFLRLGMNVSLSTDDPLQFHLSKEPLLEEYSVATQIYKLTPSDMCELARRSVLQSGWETELKRHWLGGSFHLPGPAGNAVAKSNVPDIRLRFRAECLREELELVWRYGATKPAGDGGGGGGGVGVGVGVGAGPPRAAQSRATTDGGVDAAGVARAAAGAGDRTTATGEHARVDEVAGAGEAGAAGGGGGGGARDGGVGAQAAADDDAAADPLLDPCSFPGVHRFAERLQSRRLSGA